jgi:hypothetical protein
VAVAFWRALDNLEGDVAEQDVGSPVSEPSRIPWNDTCWLPPASPVSWNKMRRVIQGFLMMHGLESDARALPDDGSRMLMDFIGLLAGGCGDGREQPIALALAEMFKRFVRRLEADPFATHPPVIGANEALVPGESSEWMTESRKIRMVGIRSLMRANHEADLALVRFKNKNLPLGDDEPYRHAYARDPVRALQRVLAQPDLNFDDFFYQLGFPQQQDLIQRAANEADASVLAELCRRMLERAPESLLGHITACPWTMPAAHLYSSLFYALNFLPDARDGHHYTRRMRAVYSAKTCLLQDQCFDAAVVLILAHFAPTQFSAPSLETLSSEAIQNIRASLPAAESYRHLAPSLFDQMAQL